MTAMTKADLAKILHDELHFSKSEAKLFVDNFFEELVNQLVQGHELRLSGFGNFLVKQKRPRPGRNPRTGEEVTITARKVVTFKAGQKMRQNIEKLVQGNPKPL